MIVLTALFCAFQFQSDEPANGRFKLNQWQYLYHYKMSQTTSELSSVRDRPVNFYGEEVVLVLRFALIKFFRHMLLITYITSSCTSLFSSTTKLNR